MSSNVVRFMAMLCRRAGAAMGLHRQHKKSLKSCVPEMPYTHRPEFEQQQQQDATKYAGR